MPRSGSPSVAGGGSATIDTGRRRWVRACRLAGGRWPRDVSAAAGTTGELPRAGVRVPPAASRPPVTMVMSPSSVTRPMTAAGRSQRRQTAEHVAAASPAVTMASIRSCDSEIMTSNGSMPSSRRGIASRSTRMPVPARSAVSEMAHVMPAAPRSWRPSTRPRSMSSRLASMSSFSANGSPTWTRRTLGGLRPRRRWRWPGSDAPPMPSRPVLEPNRTREVARTGRRGERQEALLQEHPRPSR